MVLLKNDHGVLPINPRVRSIAVIGPLADDRDAPLSHWRGDGRIDDVVTLLAGIKAKAAAKPGMQVPHARGCEIEGGSTDGFAEAVRIARQSEVRSLPLGVVSMSGEAGSRSSLDLPGHQLDLVKAIHATGTPTVVVLMNGRPLTIGWVAEHIPAILEAWLPGTEGGNAIADVLFGNVNPGAKLPVTFPRVVGQVPLYYNALNTGRPPKPDNGTPRKYLDVPWEPLFAFGHGLSYTRFRLSNLRLSRRTIMPTETVTVSVDVQNVGDRAGDEVVQLYLRDVVASVARPVRELAGFERVTLQPGETKNVPVRARAGPARLLSTASSGSSSSREFRVFVGDQQRRRTRGSLRGHRIGPLQPVRPVNSPRRDGFVWLCSTALKRHKVFGLRRLYQKVGFVSSDYIISPSPQNSARRLP